MDFNKHGLLLNGLVWVCIGPFWPQGVEMKQAFDNYKDRMTGWQWTPGIFYCPFMVYAFYKMPSDQNALGAMVMASAFAVIIAVNHMADALFFAISDLIDRQYIHNSGN